MQYIFIFLLLSFISFAANSNHDTFATCTPVPGYNGCDDTFTRPEPTGEHICSYHGSGRELYFSQYVSIPGGMTTSQGCNYVYYPGPQIAGMMGRCSTWHLVPSPSYSDGGINRTGNGEFVDCVPDRTYCPDDGDQYSASAEKCCALGTSNTSECYATARVCSFYYDATYNYTKIHTGYNVTENTGLVSFSGSSQCVFRLIPTLIANATPIDGSNSPCYTFELINLNRGYRSDIDGPRTDANSVVCEITGALLCEDGLPEDIEPWLTCDRPDLRQCSDGSYVVDTESCPISGTGDLDNDELFIALTQIYDAIIDQTITQTSQIIDSGVDTVSSIALNTDAINNNTDAAREGDIALETAINNAIVESREGDIALESAINNNTQSVISGDAAIQSGLADVVNAINNIDGNAGGTTQMGDHTSGGYGSVSEVNTAFYSSISDSPLVYSMSSMSNIIEVGGNCSALTIDLTEQGLGVPTTSIHCDIAETIRPILGGFMLVVYSIFGFRIFASA